MRSRVAFISLALAVTTFAVPLFAHAASIPFFGPIVPDCGLNNPNALGWGAFILVINNIIRFLITMLVVFIAPLMIAYAGFLLVVNSVNPAGKERAKHLIQNLIIGLVVALAAWLIVDLIMSTLYNGKFGSWYNIITTGGAPSCLSLAGQLNQAPPGAAPAVGAAVPSGIANIQCSSGNLACNVATLQSVGYSAAAANAMSCIAMTESSGNPYTPNSPTNACGTFQITQGNWNDPTLHQGSCSPATSCNDPACNMQTAYLLSQRAVASGRSPFTDWTCFRCNAKAQSCVDQYDPTMLAITKGMLSP